MAKKLVRLIAVICVISTLLVIPAFASTRASYQFTSYDLQPDYLSDGRISIYVSITATDIMDDIGCTKIRVYEKIGTSWVMLASFDENDAGMMADDAFYFSVKKYCDAYENGEFKIEATIYAKDYNGGSDSRTITTYLYT